MRYLLTLGLLLFSTTSAFAQGAIRATTPTTFVAPAAIQDWEPTGFAIYRFPATIRVEIRAVTQPSVTLTFEYPRDCGSFGSTDVNGVQVPNPPVCAARDTSAEINVLINALDISNLSLPNQNLWRRVFTFICTDFSSKFPGGCTIQ